ncbi:MAG: ATP synthase F1 subunit epsilon [Coriobacteriaceae bacterium]|nr:ATP synthase F1 subunit epsilon [Coriobacteriaceae bacterium]
MAMRIRIVCPEFNAYEGEAQFVSIPSTDGNLGVAPRHASEICTIKPGFVSICDEAMGQVSRTFAVWTGYAQITGDEIVILAEHAQDMAEVDVASVETQMQSFEDQLSNLSEDDATRSYLYNEIAWCKLLLTK